VRVLFLNSRLSERGGADRWLLGVLARLQGQVQTLLAVGYEDDALPATEHDRVGPWQRLKGLDSSGLGGTSRATVARLRDLIAQFHPDLIHANDLVDPELLEIIAGSERAILTVQDHRFFCPGRGKVDLDDRPCHDRMGESCTRCFEDVDYGRTLLHLTRRRLAAVKKMRRITVLSHYMANELAADGVPRDRIVCIPPFVDNLALDRTADAAHGEFHLMTGRLSLHKGVRIALEAARALRSDLPLVVAGEGPLTTELQERTQVHSSRIRYVGWADRSTLGQLLSRARSLWLPSLWAEPFGIVGLEAMSHAVPVIASHVGGVSEWLVDAETGFLVSPGSADDLAAAADRLAMDPSLASRLGRNGRQRLARNFDPQTHMESLLHVYTDVAVPK